MKDLIARLVGMILRRTIRGAAIADREERVRSETTAPSRAPVLPGLRIMAGCPALRTRPVALPHVRACARVRVHAHLKQSFPSETHTCTHTHGVASRDGILSRVSTSARSIRCYRTDTRAALEHRSRGLASRAEEVTRSASRRFTNPVDPGMSLPRGIRGTQQRLTCLEARF